MATGTMQQSTTELYLKVPSEIFRQLPREQAIMTCVVRLMTAVDRAVSHERLAIYSQVLGRYPEVWLVRAFEKAEASVKSWVSPADLVDLVLDPVCQQDLEWVLESLGFFGVEWADKREEYVPARRNATSGELEAVQAAQPPIQAPEWPATTLKAVLRLGCGDRRAGLMYLREHPNLWREEQSGGVFRYKVAQEIERAWRVAWMAANR